MHNSSLVHGSLNPDSLLPFSDGEGMIILDAFISTQEKEDNERFVKRLRITNFKYSSPEIIQNSRSLKREDDYWSIGLILVEMCFGRIPFDINEYFTITREKISHLFRDTTYSQELIEIIINLLIYKRPALSGDEIIPDHIQTKAKKFRRMPFDYKRAKTLIFKSKKKLKLDCKLTICIFSFINEQTKNLSHLKEICLESNKSFKRNRKQNRRQRMWGNILQLKIFLIFGNPEFIK